MLSKFYQLRFFDNWRIHICAKKLQGILLLICFFLQQLPMLACEYKYKVPQNYVSSKENIAKDDIFYYNNRFAELLPNPVVYLYGQSTSDDPILLMVFSSTIPVEWLNGQKTTNLDSIVLKLKVPEQHGYYYKILKISADQILQNVAYSKSSTISSKLSGEGTFSPQGGGGSGKLAGEVAHAFNHSKAYNSLDPIITYSGVGSDTLSLMLRRGQEFPIPNGRINVYMIVRAIRGEDPKVGNIINKYYGSDNDDDFYKNDDRFKKDLSGLICELSGSKYSDLEDFFKKNGITLDKSSGFQYKKINEFIKGSVIIKYDNRNKLIEALLEKENKDEDILKSIDKLTSYSNNPHCFLNRVSSKNKCSCPCQSKCTGKGRFNCNCKYQNNDYTDVNYKLSQNVIDFINNISTKYCDAGQLEKLVSANQKEIQLMNNANVFPQGVTNKVNISSSSSGDSSNITNSDTSSGRTSDKSSDKKDSSKSDNFNIVDNDLYAEAYKLKMKIAAYNYAICKICSPSSDFDLSDYVKNDDKDKVKVNACKCPYELEKYKKIIDLNRSIYYGTNSNKSIFDVELQKNAFELIKKTFEDKNKNKSDNDALLNFVKIDSLLSTVSNGKFCSLAELKNDSYYFNKYHDAITLLGEIAKASSGEFEKVTTCDESLVKLVANNDNNVDLKFEKTIVQYEKNTFLRFEKQYLDHWCPPLLSRVIILPIGAMLWPINLSDKRIEYNLDSAQEPIVTSKIMRGSGFDKAHMVEDGYIKDDVDYIFNDMVTQIDQIKDLREATTVEPTISNPGNFTK